MNRRIIAYLPLIAALAVGCALRLGLFFVVLSADPGRFVKIDTGTYWMPAENLLRHGAFSKSDAPPFIPEHRRTPVYPLYLAVFIAAGLGAPSIILSQIVLSVFCAVLAALCVRRITGSACASAAAAGFVALDVPSVILANSLLTETLFTVLMLGGVLMFDACGRSKKTRWIAGAGVLLGLATLCRPISFLLPVFLAAAVMVMKALRPWRRGTVLAVFLGCYLLTLAPWVVRNFVVFGKPFITTMGKNQLLYYHAAAAESLAKGIPIEEETRQLRDRSRSMGGDETTSSVAAINDWEGRHALGIIAEHPLTYAQVYGTSILSTLFKPIRNDIDVMLGYAAGPSGLKTFGGPRAPVARRFFRETSPVTVALVVFQVLLLVLIYFLAAAGFVPGSAARGASVPVTSVVMALAVLYFVLLSGPETYARFRVPLMPLLAILASIGLARWCQREN